MEPTITRAAVADHPTGKLYDDGDIIVQRLPNGYGTAVISSPSVDLDYYTDIIDTYVRGMRLMQSYEEVTPDGQLFDVEMFV